MVDIPLLIRDLVLFLMVAFVVNLITAKLSIPFTLGLVLVGLGIGLTELAPEAQLTPDLVLFVFLPLLLSLVGHEDLLLCKLQWLFMGETRHGTSDKGQVIEEPCAEKSASTVLKPSARGDSFA